ncbi:MAG TPA: hypothetical protein VGK73_01005 [Polyangiaceae bacterium]
MTRIVARVLFVSFAALVTGCGAGAQRPAEQPDPAHAPQTRVTPRRLQEREPAPNLVAPPPAYGNKIVMAAGNGSVGVN